MFGHKSFLRIGTLTDSSITGLYKDSYEVQSCNYSFSQSVDNNGKPQTEVQGGVISFIYGNTPPKDLIQWMLRSGKLENGVLVICDDNDEPLEKINFEDAACIGLEVSYTKQGKAFIHTKVTLTARKISVGSVILENKWVK